MKYWFWNRLLIIRASYWVVPTLFIFGAIALYFFTIEIDRTYGDKLNYWFLPYQGGTEGARIILASIASSMIGIAGVTFSITIVALSLASSQFGPRLLRNFMRDQGNQVVLGTFIATFLYCLLVLQSVRSIEDRLFVPIISVNLGLLFALAGLGVLIYFIHHVSNSIHAEVVVIAVARDLEKAVDRFFKQNYSNKEEKTSTLPEDFKANAHSVFSVRSGYIQAIDYNLLLRIAEEKNLIIEILPHPGKFVVFKDLLVKIWPPKGLDKSLFKKVESAISIGLQPTEQQDIEYSIRQLVEIALRALSTGVNDPFTSISCVDRLTVVLSRIAEIGMPLNQVYDKDKNLKLIKGVLTFEGICDSAISQIRQSACKNLAVSLRILEGLAVIANHTQYQHQTEVLLLHAEMIKNSFDHGELKGMDKDAFEKRYERVLSAIKRFD